MAWETIVKGKRSGAVEPNLKDYDRARSTFSWEAARRLLDGLPGGRGLNIAHEALDRHAGGALRDWLAIRWLGKDGQVEDYTYGRLCELTNRFANVLAQLGVMKGDRVYLLAGRIPELYVAVLGALKHRCVVCPLFSAFGPEPIRARLTIGRARVLVTTQSLYERKVKALWPSLPFLEHVLLIGDDHGCTDVPETQSYLRLMGAASASYTIQPTDPEDVALLPTGEVKSNEVKGRVENVAYMGDHLEYTIAAAGRTLVLPASKKERYTIGADVRLAFDPARMTILPQ